MADDILNEIRDLINKVEQGRKSNNSTGVSASSVTSLAKALAKASSSTELRRLNQEYQNLIRSAKLSANAERDSIRILNELTDAQEKTIKASQELDERFFQLAKSTGASTVQAQRFADRAKVTRGVLGRLGDAAHEGTGKISSFTDSFKGVPLVGGIIADIGSRLENNIENYRTLANTGATFNQSLVELRETAASAGLPLSDFVTLIKSNSENLASLYGSTTQGAKGFAQLSEAFRQTSVEQLMPLGLTVDELNENLLTSITLQRRLGIFDQNATAENIKAATNLTLEMDKLAKLTGQQRSAMAKQMEAQLSNARFNAFLGTQTNETRQRLQVFAAGISEISPTFKTGLEDLIANAGVPVTEASRELAMAMPGIDGIVKQLISGSINMGTAMTLMQGSAKRSQEMFRGVAQTGQVAFIDNLFPGINTLATKVFDLSAVTEEQQKRLDATTKSMTQFQDASKRLSSSFQSIETGFFATIGDVLGPAGTGLNLGMKSLAEGLKGLSNGTKALLYVSHQLGSWLLDKGAQILTTSLGVAAGIRMAGPMGGVGGGIGQVGRVAGRAGLAGLGAATTLGGVGLAGSAETSGGKALGIGTAVLGGALTGAQIGALFGPIGMAVGGLLGGLAGAGMSAVAASGNKSGQGRLTGTLGETGYRFEPKTTQLTVHKGETVLNPQEAKAYASDNNGNNILRAELVKFNTTAQATLEVQKNVEKQISRLVNINANTEENTKRSIKKLDQLGSSLV
jgi:hypothetical protein